MRNVFAKVRYANGMRQQVKKTHNPKNWARKMKSIIIWKEKKLPEMDRGYDEAHEKSTCVFNACAK